VQTSDLEARRSVRGEVMCVLAFLLLGLSVLGGAQAGATLTNDDVVKMSRAQLGTSIILTTIEASDVKFDVSPAGLIALKEAGVGDDVIQAMQTRMAMLARATPTDSAAARTGPEKSELLASSKDPDFILRNFKTMIVDASNAVYFGTAQMKAALGNNKRFASLKITIVDDPSVADVMLNVGYTFAWDYPFSLKHQNTSMVLVSGKGSGPLSGPKGASSVASELVKALGPYRIAAPAPTAKP
jgi:hypothetical protein